MSRVAAVAAVTFFTFVFALASGGARVSTQDAPPSTPAPVSPPLDSPPPRTDDPEAVALVARVLDALGGRDAVEKSADAKWVFTLQTAPAVERDPQARVRLVILSRRDGARCVTREIGGQRQLLGLLGKDGWMTHLTGEVLDLPPALRREFERDHRIETILTQYSRHGWVVRSSATSNGGMELEWVVPEGNVESRRVQMALDPKNLRPRSITYSLPAAVEAPPAPRDETPPGSSPSEGPTTPEPTAPEPSVPPTPPAGPTVTVHFENYRVVDGVSVPHRRRLEHDGRWVGTLELDDVTIGLETPDHAFARPK